MVDKPLFFMGLNAITFRVLALAKSEKRSHCGYLTPKALNPYDPDLPTEIPGRSSQVFSELCADS